MRIDFEHRITYAFLFGIGGLSAEIIGGFLGFAIPDSVVIGLVTLVLGTFGVGALAGIRNSDNGSPQANGA